MNKQIPSLPEMCAAAMNDQGFLFQQRIYHETQRSFGERTGDHRWTLLAAEVPTKANNQKDTRIDLVLRGRSRGIHLAVECKRPNPKYKAWIFFGTHTTIRGIDSNQFFFERYSFTTSQGGKATGGQSHRLQRIRAKDSVFNYYLEARIEGGKGYDGKTSSVEAIEQAFTQVTAAQNGLFYWMMDRCEATPLAVIPVIVTAAELYEIEFEIKDVALATGMIEAQKIIPNKLGFTAVNYRVTTDLASKSAFNIQAPCDIAQQLEHYQLRTIFVVQANHWAEFLKWAEEMIEDTGLCNG